MLINYLRTAWRRLWKNKGFFALNFTGLYISVTASLLIALLIIYELSFDRGGRGDLRIYRVVDEVKAGSGSGFNAVTPYPLAAALRAAVSGGSGAAAGMGDGFLPLVCQVHCDKDSYVEVGQRVMKAGAIVFADSVFPRMFPLVVREGSIARAFSEPGFVVLTETSARRYFGSGEAIGKRMKIDGLIDLQVAAVVADPAPNTHLPYQMLISYPSFRKELIGNLPIDQWSLTANGYTYIGFPTRVGGGGYAAEAGGSAGSGALSRASEAGMLAQMQRVLDDIVKKNITDKDPTAGDHYVLQPLRSIHYNRDFATSNPGYTINSSYLELLAAIGLFLILAACINYTNLSTAMALKKSKEVGVRKTLGATRLQLMRQLLAETFVLTAVVITAAGVTAGLFLPILNNFLDKQIPTSWLGWTSAAFLIVLWVLVSVVSGIYPAWVLSRFKPVTALKSVMTTPKASMVLLRRGLVVFQFMTAQVLIICAIVVSKQMQYVRMQPLGFNKNLIVDVDLPEAKVETARALRARLENLPGVRGMSFSIGAPISDNHIGTGFNRRESFKGKQIPVQVKAIDKDYLGTYGLSLAAGRWFDAGDEERVAGDLPDSVKKYGFVLNETAVKALGYRTPQEAIGKMVTFGFNNITAPVIGVVRDYHVSSMRDAVVPVLMVVYPFFYYNVGVQLAGGYSPATIDAIGKAFNAVYPQKLFNAHFLDEDIAALYSEEKRTQQLFDLFTGLSIAINVLGLIGLLAFVIEQKTKEVGIRKVLGASVQDISFLLSRDFLRLIGIAFLVAAPVAGLLMDGWLRNFAYRTSLSWEVFGLALVATVMVTCVAISFQTVRAAVRNPVRSLRSE